LGQALRVETVRPEDLGAGERAQWAAFRAADAALASPYFDLRYTLAAAEVCPNAFVAVIHRGGEVVGFLPFQRRGGLVQPLGAPLTDYHGLITKAGVSIDLADVIRGIGAARFQFSGLALGEGCAALGLVRRAMVADVAQGFEAYLAGRRAAGHSGFLKDKRRRRAALERDHAPIDFALGKDDPGALGVILRLKREQMLRAGQHDIFACGWTERLLRRLLEEPDPDFGARIAVLRTGGDIAAAEIGLRSGSAYHLWFPVYDHAYAKYSPGSLMTLDTIEAAAKLGIRTVDFGAGGEDYKAAFADPGAVVLEGAVLTSPWRAAMYAIPALRASRAKLERRLDRIAACEPHLPGQIVAASKYVGVAARRYPAATAVGLSLGAVVGLSLLAD
jgi:CelD/BcsL family acetyltransferase involved in cellulose biosynthesis